MRENYSVSVNMSYTTIAGAFRQLCDLYYNGEANGILMTLYPQPLYNFYMGAETHILYNIIVSHSYDAVCNTELINYTEKKNNPREELCAFLKAKKILLLIVNLAAPLATTYPEFIMEYAVRSKCRESIIKQLQATVKYELNIIDYRDLDDQRLLTKFLSNLNNVNTM